MDKQPWREEKRSWIFYLDRMIDDDNMVQGRTKESIFLLDCETARLSIWSKKWQVFTDVGISNLLKRMSSTWNESTRDSQGGTRIFYKGIELQNSYLADGTELLEFIDIKGDLDRKYINISRNGFTEAGEIFFKEVLYPGLTDMVQEVLRELERGADTTKFNEKIYGAVSRLCEESVCDKQTAIRKEIVDKREKLISLVGSIAVLAYLFMRDTWDVWEGLGGGHPHNGAWESLLIDLNELLGNSKYRGLMEELGTMSSMFGIKVYDEYYKEDFERGKRNTAEKNMNFSKIFWNNEHWAVLQCRKNDYSAWVSHLIRLGGASDIFTKLTTIPRSEQDEAELESWGKRLCDIALNESYEDFFTMYNFKQQMLLDWMLKNIPTVGLFCNEQGNIRLNVLAMRIYPSIYLDKNFKCLILERMIEIAWKDDIRRFSAIAWQGREYISCDKLPFSIYFAKRGYLLDFSYHKCIVPLDGELLKKWRSALKEIEKSEFVYKIALLLKDMDIVACLSEFLQDTQGDETIREYLSENNTDAALLEIASEVWDRIFAKICERNFAEQMSVEILLENEEQRREKWKKLYGIAAKIYVLDMKGELVDNDLEVLEKEIEEGGGLDELCDAWLYCCIFREKIVDKGSGIKKLYAEYMEDHPESRKKDEKIVKYIADKKGSQFNTDALKAGLDRYREELIELAQELETRRIRQYLEDNMRKYRMFTSQLTSRYERRNDEIQEKVQDDIQAT